MEERVDYGSSSRDVFCWLDCVYAVSSPIINQFPGQQERTPLGSRPFLNPSTPLESRFSIHQCIHRGHVHREKNLVVTMPCDDSRLAVRLSI
jgi:hypothetical protein